MKCVFDSESAKWLQQIPILTGKPFYVGLLLIPRIINRTARMMLELWY
ncbi:MAG: hypothetical protein ACK526_14140 [Planctomyces sp.]